jgi:xylose isomerase
MRTYLILAEKAQRFRADPDIQEALAGARSAELAEPTSPEGLGAGAIDALRAAPDDEDALAAQGYGHEHLDQLVTELLLGVR